MTRTCAVVFLALAAACKTADEKPPEFGGAWPEYKSGNEDGAVDSAWLDDVAIPAHLAQLDEEEEHFVAGACEALRSGHAAYAGAANGLIELKEPVIPYVGHYGDLHPALRARVFVVLNHVFAGLEPGSVALHLTSPYSVVRIAAADSVGARRLADNAARLVDLLDDADPDVRRAAIASLRTIYNRFYGYRPLDSARRRSRPVREWRAQVQAG
ncbi:MAG: HEAT repeat domain-containing protein [Planctomycetota bacterium]|jgi:hypothetical protein